MRAGVVAPALIAVFHYVGPAFAVLLFARLEVFGVAWLRIAGAAMVFAVWCRPWRLWRRSTAAGVRSLRNMIAVGLAMAGVLILADIRLAGEPLVSFLLGVALVIIAVAVHQQPNVDTSRKETACSTPVGAPQVRRCRGSAWA